MGRFRRNLLKTVIFGACVGLPAIKSHSQTIKSDFVNADFVAGIATSYTIPVQKYPYNMGAYILAGAMSEYHFENTNTHACAMLLANCGATRQDNNVDKYRYNIGFTVKVGYGYGRITILAVKENTVFINANGEIKMMNGHGGGVNIRIGKYVKIYGDFVYFDQEFNSETSMSDKNTNQKNLARVGLILTLLRKKNQK